MDHAVYQPEVINATAARIAFPRNERFFFGLLGIDEFLLLRNQPEEGR